MKNLDLIFSKIENNSIEKSNIDLMLGTIRGGANSQPGGYSSSYTSGTRDCDATSRCKVICSSAYSTIVEQMPNNSTLSQTFSTANTMY